MRQHSRTSNESEPQQKEKRDFSNNDFKFTFGPTSDQIDIMQEDLPPLKNGLNPNTCCCCTDGCLAQHVAP